MYAKSIVKIATAEHYDRDLKLSSDFRAGNLNEEDLTRLHNFLHEIRDSKVNRGLYVIGRPYTEAEAAEAGMSAVSTTSYDGIIEVRDAILETLDDEMLLSTTDAEFQALSDARVSVFEEMTERADRESRLMDIELPEVMPAQVVAYDYYADAVRDLEIVARNGIENGGFCPVDLRMASQ